MAQILTPFQECLLTCGLNDAQRNAIDREGFTTLDEFGLLKAKHIFEMVKRLAALTPARGGVLIGQLQIRKLEALLFWIFDRRRRSLDLDHEAFDNQVITDCLEKLDLEERAPEDNKVKSPGKLQTSATGWIQWELGFENYLAGIKGAQGLPIVYVIRKDLPADHVHVNDDTEQLYQIPLVGQLYENDNKAVYLQLKQCVLNTEGWEWIKSYDANQNGRLSMQKLRLHYDGPAATSKRIALANQMIKELHYKSEQSFSFESFITKLNGAYQVLEENGEGKSTRTKIEELLSKINSNHADIRSAIGVIRMSSEYNNDFTLTVNKLSEVITQIFPSLQGRERGRRVSAAGMPRDSRNAGRGNAYRGGRGGRHGRGGRGPGRGFRPNIVNGVDISNPNRYYTAEEWEKLPVPVRKDLDSRRNNRNKRFPPNHTDAPPVARNVSQVQHETTDMSTLSNNNQTTSSDQSFDNAAGNSFGKASYKKNKSS